MLNRRSMIAAAIGLIGSTKAAPKVVDTGAIAKIIGLSENGEVPEGNEIVAALEQKGDYYVPKAMSGFGLTEAEVEMINDTVNYLADEALGPPRIPARYASKKSWSAVYKESLTAADLRSARMIESSIHNTDEHSKRIAAAILRLSGIR